MFRVRTLFISASLCTVFILSKIYLSNTNKGNFVVSKYLNPLLNVTKIGIFSVDNKSDDLYNGTFFYQRTFKDKDYIGKKFSNSWNVHLRRFGLINVENIDDEKVLASTSKFVTAFSDNHYGEGVSMLKHLQTQNKNKKSIYVYDIGLRYMFSILSEKNKKQLLSKFADIIIELRSFPFEDYPAYVKNLNSYRWKPLIIATMLTEYDSVWWLDTSAKMIGPVKTVYSDMKSCLTTNLPSCSYYPWITVDSGGHSIFAATEPKMFDYLPIPKDVAKRLNMRGANLQLIYGIKDAKENILRYWVLCALEEGCMHPSGSNLYCQFKNRFTDYANCHRFDQSAVNILLAWANYFNDTRYHHHADNSFKIERF